MKTQNRAATYRICFPGRTTDSKLHYVWRNKKPKSSQMFLENNSKLKRNRKIQQPSSTTGFNIKLPQTVSQVINTKDR